MGSIELRRGRSDRCRRESRDSRLGVVRSRSKNDSRSRCGSKGRRLRQLICGRHGSKRRNLCRGRNYWSHGKLRCRSSSMHLRLLRLKLGLLLNRCRNGLRCTKRK